MAPLLSSSSRTMTALVILIATVAEAKSRPPTQDPFADPAHDLNNPLRYIPSNTLSAIGVSFYAAVSLAMTALLWRSRWSARYMLCVIIGGFCMAFGLGMRFALAKHPDSSGTYIVEYLFVVLSPCAFIAGNYILLGRLSRHLSSGHFLLVPPTRITKIFVASDVTTFLIQATGGSMSTADDINTALAGSHIFLAGLALQLASYAFFSIVYLVFLWRVKMASRGKEGTEEDIWGRARRIGNDGESIAEGEYRWWKDWRALAFALFVSCIGIVIRSIYRTIELSQGYVGPLATNETTFYCLDTLPLFIAVTIYVPFWPGRFIDESRLRRIDAETRGTKTRRSWWKCWGGRKVKDVQSENGVDDVPVEKASVQEA